MRAKFLVVGRNSFLASRFRALSEITSDCEFITHREAADATPYDFRSFDAIVNFALDPAYRRGPYAEDRDVDLALADKALPGMARYIMLSSRAVYARDHAVGAKEADPATGNETPYGRNKMETERRLADRLGERLTVLRIANIIGDEFGSGRRTFMGLALERLKSKGEILLDISPDVRRDFLPDGLFVQVLDAAVQEPCGGPLNVGSGQAVRVGDIADRLIEGYGSGRVEVSDHRTHDEFVLDVGRLRSIYGIDCSPADIKAHCLWIGRHLRAR